MAFDFTGSAHDHHVAYTRTNASGTVSQIKAKGTQPVKNTEAILRAVEQTSPKDPETAARHELATKMAERGFADINGLGAYQYTSKRNRRWQVVMKPVGETGHIHEIKISIGQPAGSGISVQRSETFRTKSSTAKDFDSAINRALEWMDPNHRKDLAQDRDFVPASDSNKNGQQKQPWQQTKEQYGNDEDHEVHVYRAMQGGKPVPAEVRAQYPQFGYMHRDSKKHIKKSLAGTFLLRKSDHDVSSEIRDIQGRWAKGGEGGHEQVNASEEFIPNSKGQAQFGEITPEIGKIIRRQAAPIKLRKGDEKEGLTHINRDERLQQLQSIGYNNGEEAVEDVTEHFSEIYQGRNGNLLLVLHKTPNVVVYVKLTASEHGDFYDVKTATPSRVDAFKNKKPLWERAQSNQIPENPPLRDLSGQSGTYTNNISKSKNEFNKSLRSGLWLRKSAALAGGGTIRHFAPAVFLCGDKAISHTNVAEFSGGKGGSGSGGDFIGRNKLAATVPAFTIDVDHNTLQKSESPSGEVKAPPQNDALLKAHISEYTRTSKNGALWQVRAHEDSRVRHYGHRMAEIRNHSDLHKLRIERFAHLPHWDKLDDKTKQHIFDAEQMIHEKLTEFEKQDQGKDRPTTDKIDASDWRQTRLFKSIAKGLMLIRRKRNNKN